MAPILASSAAKDSFPAFVFWKIDETKHGSFEVRKDGTVERDPRMYGSVSIDRVSARSGIFWPEAGYSSGKVGKSVEIVSPNGRWGIKTEGVLTFADDLNNVFLVVRDIKTDRVIKKAIPANSMGTMYPLFWHPTSRWFYFMVMMGNEKDRSFGLWQYDLVGKGFVFIGETDGRAFLAPDGKWLIWETGRLMDEHPPGDGRISIQIMAFHIVEGVSYRITTADAIHLFCEWK